MKRRSLAVSLCDLVTGGEDARVCKDIPDSACDDQPGNSLLQLLSSVATKSADALASARLVLPWLPTEAGAPAYLLDMATPDTRTTLVAVSNTVIGVLLLAGGVFGVVAWWLGTAWTSAEAVATARLREVTGDEWRSPLPH